MNDQVTQQPSGQPAPAAAPAEPAAPVQSVPGAEDFDYDALFGEGTHRDDQQQLNAQPALAMRTEGRKPGATPLG